MKVKVKSIMSPDIPDFKNYYPGDEMSFSFLVQLVVGVEGKDGGDVFSVEVCTPKWLLDNYKENDIIFPRGKVIVLKYDIEKILERITTYCESSTGKTWAEIANRISRFALWEFEDYRV